MSFTKETLTHLWSKITNLVDTKLQKPKNDIAVNTSSIGMSKKNLLNNELTTKILSGITFTVNDDKSITLKGTAEDTIWVKLYTIQGQYFRNKTLKFTGNPSTHTGAGEGIEAWYINSELGNSYISIANGLYLNESDYDSSGSICYQFHINKGKTYDNVTFYPMLRYTDITDGTYEPYVPDLQTQIDTINNKITDTGWVTVNLATATSNLTFDTSISNWINYRKIGSIVYVRVSMKFTSVSDENIVITNMTEVLPDEFKPNLNGIVLGRCGTYTDSQNSDYQLMYWQFNPSGSVSIYATNNQKLSTMANKTITVNGSYFVD